MFYAQLITRLNVPWLHPAGTADVAATIGLRYTLMPYLWSLFERAHSPHQPIIRPTFYGLPDDAQCFAGSDDFMGRLSIQEVSARIIVTHGLVEFW